MSSEPMDDPTDPAALPLFAPAPMRPGRVRGGFSMRPQDPPTVLDEARRRREAAAHREIKLRHRHSPIRCIATLRCGGGADKRQRGLTSRCIPPLGRSASRQFGCGVKPGASAKRKRRNSVAAKTETSVMPKAAPAQMRGPMPKGR